MPTYQYSCTACGERLEAVQSFTDATLTECPACQGQLRKVFSAVGVVFKGSGFYKNDSRPEKKEAPVKAEAKTGSTSDSTSGGAKTDAASGTKTESAKPAAAKTGSTSSTSSSSTPAA